MEDNFTNFILFLGILMRRDNIIHIVISIGDRLERQLSTVPGNILTYKNYKLLDFISFVQFDIEVSQYEITSQIGLYFLGTLMR